MDSDVVLDRIDEIVVDVLGRSEKPLTIYKIAKEAKISWATVNVHCYKLKSAGILVENVCETGVPGQKRTFWSLAAKTPKLNQFSE